MHVVDINNLDTHQSLLMVTLHSPLHQYLYIYKRREFVSDAIQCISTREIEKHINPRGLGQKYIPWMIE